jgi:thymidylate synthase
MDTTKSCIIKDYNVMSVDHFNEGYFVLHNFLVKFGDKVDSRNGNTTEFLNFKTILKNPIKRCVAGHGRNINIFFLLAEALWIWAGRRDVKFLHPFNSNLKQFSDDGIVYHAPYGWRIRHYGQSAEHEENTIEQKTDIDQLARSISMLNANPEDRRVVWNVWNPEFDLGRKSNDLPCNDQIMFKIRKGALYTTVQNRSNDLNWGLTTNVFQFSWISELMARILGVEVGDQVHNSQSLHVYLDNPITDLIEKSSATDPFENRYCFSKEFYEKYKEIPLNIAFKPLEETGVSERLKLIDFHINQIINMLRNVSEERAPMCDFITYNNYMNNLTVFCPSFAYIYELLSIYLVYKQKKDRILAIDNLVHLENYFPEYKNSDYQTLAYNFFVQRLTHAEERKLERDGKQQILEDFGNY